MNKFFSNIKHSLMIYCSVIMVMSMVAACTDKQENYVHVGPNWAALNELQASDDFSVKISGNKTYSIGDKISLKIISEQSGKLWVVYVDSDDSVSVLFPNQLSPNNEVKAGEAILLPQEGWTLIAEEPKGPSVIAAIVTTGDEGLVDLLAKFQEKSMEGALVPKAIQMAREAPKSSIDKLIINVK